MYKKHKTIYMLLQIFLFIASFLIKLDYSNLASGSFTIVSIILAIYMTLVANLVSSDLAKRMQNKEDKKLKGKSQLGVLRTYLNVAVITGIINICIGCVILLYPVNLKNAIHYVILSSLGFSTLGGNLMLMFLLYIFMVNRQLWNK